jgi:hypothetical protein
LNRTHRFLTRPASGPDSQQVIRGPADSMGILAQDRHTINIHDVSG